MIVSNPPWIQATTIRNEFLEVGNYDPSGKVLEALFSFSSKRLQINTAETKAGSLILLYSDISANFELSPKDQITKLCQKYSMHIKDCREVGFSIPGGGPAKAKDSKKPGKGKPKSDPARKDPLEVYKNISKLIVYEIARN